MGAAVSAWAARQDDYKGPFAEQVSMREEIA